jgi:hypothetical protein
MTVGFKILGLGLRLLIKIRRFYLLYCKSNLRFTLMSFCRVWKDVFGVGI